MISLLQQDGHRIKKVASTQGGEYAGACPWCGGRDRFRVWPNKNRYWCRACGKSGDAIQYLRDFRGISYQEACLFVGREPVVRSDTRPAPAAWEPQETSTPSELWRKKAKAFLDGAIDCLWSAQGEPAREWLRTQKGLSDATIKAAGLGHNPADIYESRVTWGLRSEFKEDASLKKQWIPAGLVIPLQENGNITRLRVRRDNPGDGARYVVISGSSSAPMVCGEGRGAAVIVESELDAILLSQETGDLAAAIALGSALSKPNFETHQIIQATPIILLSHDTDAPGAKAAWTFWPDTYGTKAKRWPTVKGKDASEARLNGLDLRSWIIAGLFGNEDKFERFCIQTTDGRLSDREALLSMQSEFTTIHQFTQ